MKRFVLLMGCMLFLAGCSPTYPKHQLIASLTELCKKEYGVDVSVQIAGKTLGVMVPLEKLLDSTLKLSPDVGDKLDGVILATSRVVLSTDHPLDFYVVVAQDKRIPGIELRLTRYIQDIRRLNYGDLSRTEYTKRMLLDFGIGLGVFSGKEEPFHLEEVRMEQFLATQIARRIKTAFEEESQLKEGFEIKTVHGKFLPHQEAADWGGKEKRFGRFVITLEARERLMGLLETLGSEDEERLLGASLEGILDVLQGYHFSAFDSVEIKLPFLDHSFILGRDVLELYRRKKIGLAQLLSPNNFNLPSYDAELLLKK
ncbi:MAG: hypothetical protein HY590_01455 [Candidatus Omnitrophica bacterium]|nr:hypothetical protein [Candidatus Omnitrophota bacterium]